MDFDIGNFLYILLMLVFVILGSLGKKRKPGIPPQNAQQPETEPEIGEVPADIFEENIRKYFLHSNVEEKTNEEKSYDYSENSSEPVFDEPVSRWNKYSGILDTSSPDEGVATTYRIEDHIEEITRISKLDHMLMQTAKKTDFVKRALKNFDPKKAILYKEVFDPKYF